MGALVAISVIGMPRWCLVVVAFVVGLAGVVVWPAAAGAAVGDGSAVSVDRYGGPDRYATSLLIAEAFATEAGGSLRSVVLVSGERWTDAVVAAPVAGVLEAPVLMTPPGELRGDALAFLERVGVADAVVIGPDGGGGAHGPGRGVGTGVLDALADAGISGRRVAGADLYSTSVAAANEVTAGEMGALGRTAIVASGEVFADALVAGPFAARGTHPVLLSAPDELPASVASYLGDAGIGHVVVMGGTAALSAAVESAIADLGASVTRLAGATRYDTAVKAAELVTDRYSAAAGETCFSTGTIGMARARVPFDSFSAAPLLDRLCAPLVLADPRQIPADTAAFLDAAREANDTVDLRVFGGNAAVSQAAIDAYLSGEEGEDDDADDDDETDESEEGDDADETDDDAGESDTDGGAATVGTCGGSLDDDPRPLTDTDNAEDPAWSPDCSQIVFSRGGSLWLMDNDGSNQQRLTNHDGAYSDEPAWSPDGTKIAYSRGQRNDDDHWFSHIYTVNADGTERTKVSKGDVQDSLPAWSPDGSEIAFQRLSGDGRDENGHFIDGDRHIAVMNAAGGGKPAAITAGGRWEHAPAWSPDGNRIAYVAGSVVWLVDADGSNPRRLVAGAYWNGGVSWSPDGRRIAFARGDGDESTIVVSGVDDAAETVVADLPGLNTVPRWSPDGQLIVFTNYETAEEKNVYVAGARGAAAAAAACMPRGLLDTTAGFPLPEWFAPTTGTLRVAVLFMDFPDVPAGHSTRDEAERGLPFMEEYLESVSYGHLDVEVIPHHTWLRADRPSTELFGETVLGQSLADEAGRHAVELADADVDFSDVDAVMTIFPSTHFGGGNAGGVASADGNAVPHSRTNTKPFDEPVSFAHAREWGDVAAHELVHNLGLLDLYPYDESAHELPNATRNREWVGVEWGRMNLWAWYQSPTDDSRRRLLWRFPGGGTSTSTTTHLNPQEMLAWSRWQLGWLDETQIRCLGGADADAVVTLSPIAQPGGGVAMAAVQLNGREVIVIESRRKLGYDNDTDYRQPNGGRTMFPHLIEEGVLVYTVDTLVASGELPMRVAGDSGDGIVDDFPVLVAGESVTVRGYTITVTANDADTHTVTITPST